MAQDNRSRPAFEAGAEEELERIRRALDESRQRRREASDAFDAFLRSFGPRSGREPRPVDPRSMDVRSIEAPSPAPAAPPAPPVGARELVGGSPPASEFEPPITEPSPPTSTPEPRRDASVPLVSVTPPASAPRPIVSASPPPETAPAPLVSATPEPAGEESWPPVSASQPEAIASPTAIVPEQPVTEPPIVPVPELPPIAVPTVDAHPEPSASDQGESWIPEPTTPLKLIQEDGTLESLLPEPPQLSGSSSAESRAYQPVVPAGLRQSLERRGLRREHVAAAAVILVVLAVLLIWRMSSSPDDRDAVQRASPSSAAPVAAAPAQQAQASAPVSGLQVELRTIRRVWLRVVVDGEKSIEREVPADERIPITGQKAIVIRAGDAGAVHVAVNGEDRGPFGTDGFPATRTFTPPR